VNTVLRRFVPDTHHGSNPALVSVVLACALLALVAITALTAFRAQPQVAPDFHYAYFPAAQRLLRGVSPYALPHQDIAAGIAFVYPALSALVFAPFALLGRPLADHLYVLLCFALVPATLWLARVRDWRLYALPMLWAPVVLGWEGGNVSVPLTFLVMLLWRYRDRPLVAGFVTALAISLKPFVWPLALWLVVTRRWRAAGYALLSGLLLNLAAWAIIGFNQISAYLRLSAQVTDALWRGGYSMLALAHHLGFGRGVGEAVLLVASAALIAGLVWLGLVRRRDRDALTLTVALMLVASPLVWSHYFVLLLVPLALARPRFDPIWLLPCAMWICPPSTAATGREVVLAWLVAVSCLVTVLRGGSEGRRLADRRPYQSRSAELVAAR
jgi:hypothetical protein